MADIKPVVAVAALMGVIVGEEWLRGKVYQSDVHYVGILDLIGGMATRVPGRGWASSCLRPLPQSLTRTYRASLSWTPDSKVPSLEGHLGE